MSAYLICRAKVKTLDTVIFFTDPYEKEEAVAVFTDSKKAEAYLSDAAWVGEYTVATVDAIPFLKWLLQLHDEGVQYLVIDPKYADQQAGIRMNTLSIKGHLEHAGNHIVDVARPDY